ncbi:MAG: UDP-N-acetylmuramate dehydrogenase [Spirochaetota bacterium]
MPKLKQNLANINIAGAVRVDEPMAEHTTFRVGGPADVYVRPQSVDDVQQVLKLGRREGVRVFTLGGGANILVADAGIRGIVMDMRDFAEISVLERHGVDGQDGARAPKSGATHRARIGAGLPVSDAAAELADRGLAGLDFLYAMPGSVGGAVWMNARCYGSSIIDVLEEVDIVTTEGDFRTYLPQDGDFDYKVSPFQTNGAVILAATIRLREEEPAAIWKRMRDHEEDRTTKGHFSGPSAGSVFKNNRAFGRPSGKIIDSLGLRGYQIGGARISDRHANIIINTGTATARDIRELIEFVEKRVEERLGLRLEREVLYAGEWGS